MFHDRNLLKKQEKSLRVEYQVSASRVKHCEINQVKSKYQNGFFGQNIQKNVRNRKVIIIIEFYILEINSVWVSIFSIS